MRFIIIFLLGILAIILQSSFLYVPLVLIIIYNFSLYIKSEYLYIFTFLLGILTDEILHFPLGFNTLIFLSVHFLVVNIQDFFPKTVFVHIIIYSLIQEIYFILTGVTPFIFLVSVSLFVFLISYRCIPLFFEKAFQKQLQLDFPKT